MDYQPTNKSPKFYKITVGIIAITSVVIYYIADIIFPNIGEGDTPLILFAVFMIFALVIFYYSMVWRIKNNHWTFFHSDPKRDRYYIWGVIILLILYFIFDYYNFIFNDLIPNLFIK